MKRYFILSCIWFVFLVVCLPVSAHNIDKIQDYVFNVFYKQIQENQKLIKQGKASACKYVVLIDARKIKNDTWLQEIGTHSLLDNSKKQLLNQSLADFNTNSSLKLYSLVLTNWYTGIKKRFKDEARNLNYTDIRKLGEYIESNEKEEIDKIDAVTQTIVGNVFDKLKKEGITDILCYTYTSCLTQTSFQGQDIKDEQRMGTLVFEYSQLIKGSSINANKLNQLTSNLTQLSKNLKIPDNTYNYIEATVRLYMKAIKTTFACDDESATITQLTKIASDFIDNQIKTNQVANQGFSIENIKTSNQQYILNHLWTDHAWNIKGLLDNNNPDRELNTKLMCLANLSKYKVYVHLQHYANCVFSQSTNYKLAQSIFEGSKLDKGSDILIFVSNNISNDTQISIVFGKEVPKTIQDYFTSGNYLQEAKLEELGGIVTALYKILPKKQLIYECYVSKASYQSESGSPCISVYGNVWASEKAKEIQGSMGCGNAVKIAIYIQNESGKWQEQRQLKEIKEEYVTAAIAHDKGIILGYEQLGWSAYSYEPVNNNTLQEKINGNTCNPKEVIKLPNVNYEGTEYADWVEHILNATGLVLSPFDLDFVPDGLGLAYYSFTGRNDKASLYAVALSMPFVAAGVLKGAVYAGKGIIKGVKYIYELKGEWKIVFEIEQSLAKQADGFLKNAEDASIYHIATPDENYYIKYDPTTGQVATCVIDGTKKEMHLIDFETGISTGRLHEPPTQSEIERFVKECVTGCFVANTKIRTQSGEKEIEKIEANKDSVWAWSEKMQRKVLKKVEQVFVKTSKQVCKLFLAGSLLIATPEHKFADSEGNWIAAHNLAGREIISFSGEPICVERVEIKDSLIQVYNLEVEDEHNYFAGSLLAHNNCNCSNGIIGLIADLEKTFDNFKNLSAVKKKSIADKLEQLGITQQVLQKPDVYKDLISDLSFDSVYLTGFKIQYLEAWNVLKQSNSRNIRKDIDMLEQTQKALNNTIRNSDITDEKIIKVIEKSESKEALIKQLAEAKTEKEYGDIIKGVKAFDNEAKILSEETIEMSTIPASYLSELEQIAQQRKLYQAAGDAQKVGLESEKAAEKAAEAYIVKRGGSIDSKLESALSVTSKQGQFDAVYEIVIEKNKIIVIEAKGGSSVLGGRMGKYGGGTGRYNQQGSRTYLEDIIGYLRFRLDFNQNGIPNLTELENTVSKLERALRDENIEYIGIRQNFNNQGDLQPTEITHFKIF